jgi:mannose-1-phosphate guanylyltransferase
MRRFAVIMAGGSGERFWPASRRLRPKQLLRLTDARQSMIEEAIERIAPLIPVERILIATSEPLAGPIREALAHLPHENVIAEPEKRNTAACLALAAAHLAERFGDPESISVAVLTADHRIGDPERFRAAVDSALRYAEERDALVTIGVVPTRPETGYGYVEVDAQALAEAAPDGVAGSEVSSQRVLPVARFREKPDLATATEFGASGRHFWNSGMFFWRTSTFLAGLSAHMPDLASATESMRRAISLGEGGRAQLREAFLPLADVSVDVGVMERAANVYVLPATFPWDDVGAWDALARSRLTDEHGNVVEGEAVLVDARDCIVYNQAGGESMAVVVIGLDDVVVATTPDGVLVCRKDRVQDVRRAVAELRARGRDSLT